MDLSLCMIVKNEARNLSRCLESVRSIVNEMVVLDTGSTDETIAIATSFNAKVHHFPWNNDFSAARNESLNYANGDWVLVLDADEVLTEAIAPVLKQAIQQENCLVINLLRQEVGATQSPYSMVSRLFRRHPDIHFSRPYHAMIDDSVVQILQREPQWQILDLPDVAMRHYGYEPGAIASRNKLENARMSMERFLVANPGEPYVCSKLGALYIQMGRLNHGIELLERGLKARQVDAPVLYELHYHLGIAYSHMKHPEQAAQHYQVAVQQPILPCLKLGAYNNLGSLRKGARDWVGARSAYEATLEIDPNFAVGHNNLAMTLKDMGQFSDAIAHYQKAIELNPTYAEAYQNLGVVLLKVGRVDDSLEAFRKAIALHQQHDLKEAVRLKRGLQEMGFQI
jgi:glycosyltransferase involved in cell wall biosynthesis